MPFNIQSPRNFMLYHDTHHPGINATLTNIRRECCWDGMFEQVKDYVGTVH